MDDDPITQYTHDREEIKKEYKDFIDLFDSILFLNESNGISSNETTLLGDFTIGGNLSILGGGDILI